MDFAEPEHVTLLRGRDMERYARDSLLFPIVGGSSAIQKNNVANRPGLPR